MNKDLKNYIELINKNFDEFQKRFNVKKIAVFGSTARGLHTNRSDIDVIVEFKKPIGLFEFVKLENRLAEILGKRVDLTTKNALKSEIKKSVLKEAVYA